MGRLRLPTAAVLMPQSLCNGSFGDTNALRQPALAVLEIDVLPSEFGGRYLQGVAFAERFSMFPLQPLEPLRQSLAIMHRGIQESLQLVSAADLRSVLGFAPVRPHPHALEFQDNSRLPIGQVLLQPRGQALRRLEPQCGAPELFHQLVWFLRLLARGLRCLGGPGQKLASLSAANLYPEPFALDRFDKSPKPRAFVQVREDLCHLGACAKPFLGNEDAETVQARERNEGPLALGFRTEVLDRAPHTVARAPLDDRIAQVSVEARFCEPLLAGA